MIALLAALLIGIVGGLLQIVPVTSQVLTLEALRAPAPVPQDDPWAAVWNGAPKQEVVLSAQNIAAPFGGGTVEILTARALHDGETMFILLEWADTEVDDTVSGVEEFADAAAVQFPADPDGSAPAFTMGATGSGVNIWQWKAVWQADIERGFDTTLTRYPNTYTDFYPGSDDTLYSPALHVGNPLAAREQDSPIENLVAEGFGTLTHADLQDVAGIGAWRDGRWRALFLRQLEPAADGFTRFEVGETTSIAFAVWDGGAGDRNGQKSIAPWIDLTVGDAFAATDGGPGGRVLLIGIFAAIVVIAVGAYLYAVRQQARSQ